MKTLSLNPAMQSVLASLVAGALPSASADQLDALKDLQLQLESESLVPVVLVRRNDNDEMTYTASAPVHVIYLEDDESGEDPADNDRLINWYGTDCWISQVKPPVLDFTEYLQIAGAKGVDE